MDVSAQVKIAAPNDRVWSIITDFENCARTISGIKEIKVLNRPDNGIVGLKWQETREMFGKDATETMWITDAEDGRFYQTRAENHGAIYVSRMSVEPEGDGCVLTMSFNGSAQTIFARVMMALTGWMMTGPMKKLIQKDLDDIKLAAEAE